MDAATNVGFTGMAHSCLDRRQDTQGLKCLGEKKIPTRPSECKKKRDVKKVIGNQSSGSFRIRDNILFRLKGRGLLCKASYRSSFVCNRSLPADLMRA